jgi:hypothetical protein
MNITRGSTTMTSTRDPKAPRVADPDHSSTDDTTGFAGINTTRSNIKNCQKSLGVPPLGLGGGLTPAFESGASLVPDVVGFVTTDQPSDDAAVTEDTVGFTTINTTRSNIPSKPSQNALGSVSPLGISLMPTFGLVAPAGADVAGFVATDPPASERDQLNDDTTGFGSISTTRSNIKPAAVLGLGGPLGALQLLPSFGVAGIAVPEVGSQIAIKENGIR